MKSKVWLLLLVLVLAACAEASGSDGSEGILSQTATPRNTEAVTDPTAIPSPTEPEPTATEPDPTATEPDPTATEPEPSPSPTEESATVTPTVAAQDHPPRGAEQQFSTDFSQHSVPYDEILSGGPPKDGIPAIDSPNYVSIEAADEWLEPEEPVIALEIDGEARAYPIQILMWHEIVNDTLNEVPVTVTFCPLCNTGIAFERTLDGQVLDFGTTGRLRFSNLIMYDRQTETWWQQATGEGIAGEHTGRQLTFLPASMISWEAFKASYPEGDVLSRDTGYNRRYGSNPYVGYDNINRSPFLYRGPDTPEGLPAMARVVTVEKDDAAVAYPYEALQAERVINDTIAETPITVFWAPGTSSALDKAEVSGGRDVGAGLVYARELEGRTLTFNFENGKILDQETGSEWNLLGEAVAGPLAGSQLEPVVSVNHFWFSWAAFKPDTRIYES